MIWCNVCGNPGAQDAGYYALAEGPALCGDCTATLYEAALLGHSEGPALLARRHEAEQRLEAIAQRPVWALAGKVSLVEYVEAHRQREETVERLQAMARLRVKR